MLFDLTRGLSALLRQHLGLEEAPTAAAGEDQQQQPAAAETEAPRAEYDRRKEPEFAAGE